MLSLVELNEVEMSVGPLASAPDTEGPRVPALATLDPANLGPPPLLLCHQLLFFALYIVYIGYIQYVSIYVLDKLATLDPSNLEPRLLCHRLHFMFYSSSLHSAYIKLLESVIPKA